MISNGQRHKKGEAEGKHHQREGFRGQRGRRLLLLLGQLMSSMLCYNRVCLGRRSRAFCCFVFGDMNVLDKHPPLSPILDPKGVHLPDTAGRKQSWQCDNSGQDREMRF